MMITKQQIKAAIEYVGGWSETSKMPCPSYSIHAQECKLGQKMRNVTGSVCSKCYALKGRYVFGNVKNALYRRFNTLELPLWVDSFVTAINGRGLKYFRWHDSGDLQSVEHLRNIVEIAKRCPDCKFWLPTRETVTVAQYVDNGGVIPENLTIRISGIMLDGNPPVKLAENLGLVVSNVSSDLSKVNCRAFENEGKCGDCRACWDKNTFEIVYKKH